ncbi:hypothetical protein V2J09_005811 [Rumex salicifolius]
MGFGKITSCFKPKREEAKKTVKKPQDCSPQRISLLNCSNPDGSEMSMNDLSNSLVGSNLFVFSHDELRLITNNFAISNYLGEGGFGAVYKGFIDDSLKTGLDAQLVAVKMLDLEGKQGHKEWLTEVIFLGQLRHEHLVKLIGYCYENDQRSLVYEYMERGNLDSQLFRRCSAPLPWLTRMKIAVEAAKGLAFLHEENQPVIFRDFKAANILLSPNYTAKLSDFGFARDGPGDDKTHISTQNILGTKGYVAPEYIMTGHLTTMSDVYSYGVVLLELLTGRRCMDKSRPRKEQSLVDWARPRLKDYQKLDLIMDPRLEGQYSLEGAKIAAHLAYQCLSHQAKTRPTMGTVVKTLGPLLDMKDDMPFVYVVPGETNTRIDAQKRSVVKVEVVEKRKEKGEVAKKQRTTLQGQGGQCDPPKAGSVVKKQRSGRKERTKLRLVGSRAVHSDSELYRNPKKNGFDDLKTQQKSIERS